MFGPFWLETLTRTQLNSRLQTVTGKFNALEKNPDLAHIFEDIKRGGNPAAMQHYHNEPLMLKISRAMGGVPDEVKTVLQDIQNKPITLQEACFRGAGAYLAFIELYQMLFLNSFPYRHVMSHVITYMIAS